MFSAYLIKTVDDRFRVFNYPKVFVVRVKM